jgi:GntR family transcriptional regulator, arabinose operon transcriptional repressor
MPSPRQLRPVVPRPGRPLYQIVKQAIREAIDAGFFTPGEQMPSTQDLSQQLEVSLVTAHRALQELVAAGILQRAQGRGTFVHERYHDKTRAPSQHRVGLVFHAEASFADFFHGGLLEGVRRGAHERAVDLIHLRHGDDVRNECNGYLFVNPCASQLEAVSQRATKRHPVLVVGARATTRNVVWYDVDNVQLARTAVEHLGKLGHRRIGYVGGAEKLSNARDRWLGFSEGCRARGIEPDAHFVIKGAGWKLDHKEQTALLRMLGDSRGPTAIFAAGYYFALDVYAAAATAGLRIPADLSVVGVDDPESAARLFPPLTTLRQPLIELGRDAVAALCEQMRHDSFAPESKLVQAELMPRSSTAPPAPE